MLDITTFQDLYSAGLHAMPVVFNTDTRVVTHYPRHVDDTNGGVPSLDDVVRWLSTLKTANGVALKLFPPYGMLDFDLKNTSNKNLYADWYRIIEATSPDTLRKVCIETTRSSGYHVYIKHQALREKITVARSAGAETVSVYTGGLLSFCAPSPGYKLIHNDFGDLAELTPSEYDLLITTAALFNEDSPAQLQAAAPITDYPTEYESICLQFDNLCTDELFETLLNSIGLTRVNGPQFARKPFVPFLRNGSTAAYSAKAYFHSKRLLIFSASMIGFPTWHDSARAGDNRWSLSPAKIVYYKNARAWEATMSEIHMICESAGIDLVETSTTPAAPVDRLRFPYDIFPEFMIDYIMPQTIQHEYLAGAMLAAISAAIGNSCVLQVMDGYEVKPILYIAIVAPPGASKSPALKVAFGPLEAYDEHLYKQYAGALTTYKDTLTRYEHNKKSTDKPEKPAFNQVLIKDATIETVVRILNFNPVGCCVLADELSGFLARMNQYKTGDEVQKWLELWSGSPLILQRITRDDTKVQEPCCSIIGGIQPGVLEVLSADANQHNGFFHRFLFVYPEPQPKPDFGIVNIAQSIKIQYRDFFLTMLNNRIGQMRYTLSPEAQTLYTIWFNAKNIKYNQAISDHYKGIIAKYQDYCLRFALILQVCHDGPYRAGTVTGVNMERAIRLTEYFLGNMIKAIRILAPETPVEKLGGFYDLLYKQLPEAFTLKTAIAKGKELGMNESNVKMFIRRHIGQLFNQVSRGVYEKIY